MTATARQRLLPLGIAAVALVAGYFVFQHADPNEGGRFWPRCVFHDATGLHCPGCGSTRALHALSHGDFATALAKNSLLVIALPLLLVLGFRMFWNGLFPEKAWLPGFRLPKWAALSILGVAILFAVLRNLPAFQFLSPG